MSSALYTTPAIHMAARRAREAALGAMREAAEPSLDALIQAATEQHDLVVIPCTPGSDLLVDARGRLDAVRGADLHLEGGKIGASIKMFDQLGLTSSLYLGWVSRRPVVPVGFSDGTRVAIHLPSTTPSPPVVRHRQ